MTNNDADGCASLLTIDLGAIRANYRVVASHAPDSRSGAVVKADAYGLGAPQVAAVLYEEGCRSFFVARLDEAAPVAAAVGGDSAIFILNGLDPGTEIQCANRGFLPVINSQDQLARWRALARERAIALPAALQIDTGMSRLGLSPQAATALAKDPGLAHDIDLKLIMTHLACADQPGRDANRAQLECFSTVCVHYRDVPVSIANSGGTFLSPRFHCDLVRPGIALYGVAGTEHGRLLRPTLSLEARVIQIRAINKGTGVGYGLDHVAAKPECLATIAIGYADGWPRSLARRGAAWHRGVRLPIVGRVSMDSTTVDISGVASGALAEGDMVELIGASQSLADIARDADTIAYEILTQLGRRHARIYRDSVASNGGAPGGSL